MPAFPSRRHPDDLHRRGGWFVVARGRCTARRSHRRFGSVAYSAGLFCAAGGGSCSCSCCYCCCRPTHREQFCSDLACSGCLRFGYPACFGRSVLCLQRVSGCSPSVRLVSPRLPVPCGHCAMSRDPFSGFVYHVCHPPCLQFPEPCGPCNLSAFHVDFTIQHRCIACGELDVFAPPLAIIHVDAILSKALATHRSYQFEPFCASCEQLCVSPCLSGICGPCGD